VCDSLAPRKLWHPQDRPARNERTRSLNEKFGFTSGSEMVRAATEAQPANPRIACTFDKLRMTVRASAKTKQTSATLRRVARIHVQGDDEDIA
jgi:pheromone shutdown protein TraB